MRTAAWVRRMAGVLAVCVLVPAGAAADYHLDPETVTCAAVPSLAERTLLGYWLDGYLNGRAGPPDYHWQRFDQVSLAVARACEADPGRTLVSIIKTLRR